MGSINPVFMLSSALEADTESMAEGFVNSVTLGVGQFCTNPGLVIGLEGSHLQQFRSRVADLVREAPAGTMLYPNICRSFEQGVNDFQELEGVDAVAHSNDEPDPQKTEAAATVLTTDADTFLSNQRLHDEVFGPSSLIVRCASLAKMEAIAQSLDGQLTASIHGTEEELRAHAPLVDTLQRKAGRLIFNDFPTGVAVCHAMNHGGPYPATTDVRSTSVGTAAIERFVRPVCYQSFPEALLPEELRDSNPRAIWRLVDGEMTRDAVSVGV